VILNNKLIFPVINSFSIEKDKYIACIFSDKYKNLLALGGFTLIYIYNLDKKQIKELLFFGIEDNKCNSGRLLNVLG